MVPSVNSAHNTTSWAADGSTRPRMFSTLLVSFTALSRSPVTPARLAMNRLPNAWPSSAPPWKRYSNSWVISGSDSASATRQSRMSPGGRMPSSRRSRPELPPSSNTVTTAVRLLVNSFSPRSSVERPVPPPMTTMRGPRRRWRCGARTSTSWCRPGGRRAPAMARTVPCRPANTASNPPPMNATPSQLGDSAPRLQVSTATARRNIENSIQPSGRTLTMSRTPADSNTMPAAINTAQRLVVVRVGQEPHVEHEVGVERNAIFVPKREHGDGECDRVRTAHERVHDRVAQFAHAEGGRVDDLVGFLFHGLQPVPLGTDAVHDAARLGQGVLAARLFKAADQHIVGRIEEEDDIVQPHRFKGVQRGEQIVEKLPPARVDGQRRALDTTFRLQAEFGELRQQRRRQVVHAEEAEVLKHLHGVRLPRAG